MQCKKHKTHLQTAVNYLSDHYPNFDLTTAHLDRATSLSHAPNLPTWFNTPQVCVYVIWYLSTVFDSIETKSTQHDVLLLKGVQMNGFSDQVHTCYVIICE